MQQVEPTVGLDVEDQIEFPWIFVGQEVTAFDTSSVQQHVDVATALAYLADDSGDCARVREVDAEIVSRAASRAHRVNRALGSLRALQSRQFFFNQRGSSPFAARLHARKQFTLESFFITDKALEVGILGIGLRHKVEQIECPARSGCEIRSDGRDNTSGRAGDDKDAVLVERQAGFSVGGRQFLQSDCPALSLFVSDLDRAGIAQSFVDEELGKFRRYAIRFKIDRFDEGIHPLSFVSLGESDDRAAQRSDRSRCVVAVLSSEARRRHQKRARSGDLFIERAHGYIKRLDADANSFMPGIQAHVDQTAFLIECGQPVDSVYWPGGQPVPKLIVKCCGVQRAVDAENFHAESLKPLLQRITHAAFIRHDHHAAARCQNDSGLFADRERRTQRRCWHAPRNPVCGFKANGRGARSSGRHRGCGRYRSR